MKKYFLSFFLIVAFAFYVALNNESSLTVGPAGGVPIAANTGTAAGTGMNVPAGGTPAKNNAFAGGNESAGDDGAPAATTVPAPTSAPAPTPTPAPSASTGAYKDGSYTGSVADAFYGNVQVKAVVQGGKLTDVQILQYPSDRGTSVEINSAAMPQLVQEAIQAQSANVNIVSGATQSSQAFQQSLAAALAQA